jgi:hypothetical protein
MQQHLANVQCMRVRLCLISQDCRGIQVSQGDEQQDGKLRIPRITESPLNNTVNKLSMTRISRLTVRTSC